MQPSSKYLFINSLLAFVAAFLLTTFIHESGHFVSFLVFNAQPVLHHNYVATPGIDLSVTAQVISSMAGPVISLIQGTLFLFILSKCKKASATNLLFLWMGFLGLINFFGYLMLTPISQVGDTGKAAALLNIPVWGQILIAISGLIIILIVIFRYVFWYGRFIPHIENIKERGRYVNVLLLYPVMLGSLINAAFAFPMQALLSIIYPLTSSYIILWGYGKVLKADEQNESDTKLFAGVSPFILSVLVAIIIIDRLLVSGFSFG